LWSPDGKWPPPSSNSTNTIEPVHRRYWKVAVHDDSYRPRRPDNAYVRLFFCLFIVFILSSSQLHFIFPKPLHTVMVLVAVHVCNLWHQNIKNMVNKIWPCHRIAFKIMQVLVCFWKCHTYLNIMRYVSLGSAMVRISTCPYFCFFNFATTLPKFTSPLPLALLFYWPFNQSFICFHLIFLSVTIIYSYVSFWW
jgi:hypothetical protein